MPKDVGPGLELSDPPGNGAVGSRMPSMRVHRQDKERLFEIAQITSKQCKTTSFSFLGQGKGRTITTLRWKVETSLGRKKCLVSEPHCPCEKQKKGLYRKAIKLPTHKTHPTDIMASRN